VYSVHQLLVSLLLFPTSVGPDGLVEGFYDPNNYNPEEGKFIMGLQFHPERMRNQDSDEFDYPGCSMAYQVYILFLIVFAMHVKLIKEVQIKDFCWWL
jgi:hypothetical protein